ncbi:MAG: ribosome hibernation-promoting factor, HPF/YfiA family [Gemmatimonadales bacterium]
MRTNVTARHCEIPDALKQRAEELVVKVAKKGHRPQRAEVVFDADHGRKVVELHLHFPRGRVNIASGEADDFRSALDQAVDRLRNQLDKTGRRNKRRQSV